MRYSPTSSRPRLWLQSTLVALVALFLIAGPLSASNDPLFDQQWALGKIGAPAAWASSTGAGVRIGIVDTGIDLAHEDLGKVVAHTSCIGSGGDPAKCSGSGQDEQGHGTHVAGIAAATKDNSRGIAGVAPDAELVVVKALKADGTGHTDDINAGIRWVVDNGARVVNLSLGGDFLTTSVLGTSLVEGIQYAWSKGAVTVLAAGNTNLLGLGIGSSQYGALPAIVVGSTDRNDRPAKYSSPLGNARWGILAPGGGGGRTPATDIYSTYWKKGKANQYRALAGTSMATPHVAGAAALLMAQGLSADETVARILNTAQVPESCRDRATCRGRLDVAAAVTGTSVTKPPEATETQTGLLGIPVSLDRLPLLGGLLSAPR